MSARSMLAVMYAGYLAACKCVGYDLGRYYIFDSQRRELFIGRCLELEKGHRLDLLRPQSATVVPLVRYSHEPAQQRGPPARKDTEFTRQKSRLKAIARKMQR